MAEFRMPSLGADMDEGTLLEWVVKPGDEVHKGDIVAVVDTDKSAVDVETFDSGVVQQLLVEPGTRVPVGTPLALIGEAGPAPGAAPAPAAPAPAAAVPELAPMPTPARVPDPRRPAMPSPGPVVRRLAEAAGLDLSTVVGTGRGGRLTRADVERAVAAGVVPATVETTAPGPMAPTGQAPVEVVPARPAAERARVTPYARRRARELGVDLGPLVARLKPGQVLRAADVVAAAPVAAPAAAPSEALAAAPTAGPTEAPAAPRERTGAERAASMRRAIARLMSRSNREIPHYYLSTTVDVSLAQAWLREHNAKVPITERLVMAAVFAKATALAAREVPDLNGWWVDDAFRPSTPVHLGIPVSLREGGLVTPAVHDADRLALPELMAALRDLVERARRGNLRSSELTDATITLTNLGDRGVESVLGVIYPPQVALVGFGRIVERPWAVDGMLAVRPVVTVTLSGDHRASDGHRGGQLLEAVDHLLQQPEAMA